MNGERYVRQKLQIHQQGPETLHTCSNQALPLDDPKATHAAAVPIQAVLLVVPLTPATDSFHFAAILRLPAYTCCTLCLHREPPLFIEMFPGLVGCLIVAQLLPILAGRADATEIFRMKVVEYLMHVAGGKSSY